MSELLFLQNCTLPLVSHYSVGLIASSESLQVQFPHPWQIGYKTPNHFSSKLGVTERLHDFEKQVVEVIGCVRKKCQLTIALFIQKNNLLSINLPIFLIS